jgi:hypothetical protein
VEKISEKYCISISTIYRWIDRYSYYLNYYNQLRNRYHMNLSINLLYLYEEQLHDIFQYDRKLFNSPNSNDGSKTSIK